MNNSEFDLLEMSAARTVARFPANNGAWPTIEVQIRLSRRPLFYVFNHVSARIAYFPQSVAI